MAEKRPDIQLYELAKEHVGVKLSDEERDQLAEQIEKLSGDIVDWFEDAKFGDNADHIKKNDHRFGPKLTSMKVDALMAVGAEDRGSQSDKRIQHLLDLSYHELRYIIDERG